MLHTYIYLHICIYIYIWIVCLRLNSFTHIREKEQCFSNFFELRSTTYYSFEMNRKNKIILRTHKWRDIRAFIQQ